MRRARTRGVMGLGWIATGCLAGALAAGCQLQGQCDASSVTVGDGTGTGKQAFQPGAGMYATGSGVAWQSSPIEGTWMDFPPERTYTIYPKLPDGGPLVGPYNFLANVSPDPSPVTTPGSNFALVAGNIAEFEENFAGDGGRPTFFTVTNETCSPYTLWVSATQEYADADGGAAPSGSPTDSGLDSGVAGDSTVGGGSD